MKRCLFAIALVMLACSAYALELDVPLEMPTNTPFSAEIGFDTGNFDAVVELNGENVLTLYSRNGKLSIDSVNKASVLNLDEGDDIEGTMLYVLFNGVSDSGNRTVVVEELDKAKKEKAVLFFSPVSRESLQRKLDALEEKIDDYDDGLAGVKNTIDSLLADTSADRDEFKSGLEDVSSRLEGLQSDVSLKADAEGVSELETALQEQELKITNLQDETEEFTSTGFISLGSLGSDPRVIGFGLIIVIVIVVALIAKGVLPKIKLPKRKKSIYNHSSKDEAITAQVMEEAAGGPAASPSSESSANGKWAFKGNGWKPKHETSEKPSGLGNLIRRN